MNSLLEGCNRRVLCQFSPMTIRDRAIEAIRELPEDAGIHQVLREVAFLAGIEEASSELDQGLGLTADEAKRRLAECLSK